ncbi:MAG: GNAT family N-acetyltransferase [Actinomycetia bacterium]|nr:GNAT family N-acetyltransferase [Actinomycetes bacterium]
MRLRDAGPEDEERILAWNEADVHFLAPMDRDRLAYLHERANAVEIIESGQDAAGFIITFIEGADYDSENYCWFSEHETHFHYVDRIVIDPAFRGRGLAADTYAALAERYPQRPLVAEVNYAPPNPASLAFHERGGFTEVGRRGDQSYGVVLLRASPSSHVDG